MKETFTKPATSYRRGHLATSFFYDMRAGIIFIIIVTLLGCSKPGTNSSKNLSSDSLDSKIIQSNAASDTSTIDNIDLYKLESYLTKLPFEIENFEIIDFNCAILIYPTKEQIDEMKQGDEDDFYIVADDNNWYQGMAIEIIDSLSIKTVTANKRFIRFKGQQKSWDLDIRKRNLPEWNLIFFKTNKEPKIIPTIELTLDSLKEYFEIKD
ncbi:MAG: hypothetical protein U0T82_12795 [Bacteroidales bacterium]